MDHYKIVVGKLHHAHLIADFQLKMALETENLKLNEEIVNKIRSQISDFFDSGP